MCAKTEWGVGDALGDGAMLLGIRLVSVMPQNTSLSVTLGGH